MWPVVNIFENHKRLKNQLTTLNSKCEIFQFEETQPRKYMLYYSTYPTKVTACIVPSQPHE